MKVLPVKYVSATTYTLMIDSYNLVLEVKNLEASPVTKERIKQIEFDSRRQGRFNVHF